MGIKGHEPENWTLYGSFTVGGQKTPSAGKRVLNRT